MYHLTARATASSATLELLDAFRKITQGQRVSHGLTIVHNDFQVERRYRVGSAAKTCTVANHLQLAELCYGHPELNVEELNLMGGTASENIANAAIAADDNNFHSLG